MNEPASNALLSLSEHVAAVERDFLELAKVLDTMDESSGRLITLAAFRAVQRLAESARAVRARCPKCSRPDSRLEYEAVNKLSGVWKLPECPGCRELSSVITAVEKTARSLAATSNT